MRGLWKKLQKKEENFKEIGGNFMGGANLKKINRNNLGKWQI